MNLFSAFFFAHEKSLFWLRLFIRKESKRWTLVQLQRNTLDFLEWQFGHSGPNWNLEKGEITKDSDDRGGALAAAASMASMAHYPWQGEDH